MLEGLHYCLTCRDWHYFGPDPVGAQSQRDTCRPGNPIAVADDSALIARLLEMTRIPKEALPPAPGDPPQE